MAKEVLELEVQSNLGDVVKQTEKLDDATKKGKKGFQGIGTAVKGVGVALKAAGIGLVVALLAKLMEVFSKNQKVLDFFNTAMTALSIAFNDLFKYLDDNIGTFTGYFKELFEDPKQSLIDFGDAIKENLIERFNSLLETFGYVGSALAALFKGNFEEAGKFAKLAGKELIDVSTGIDNAFDKATETIVKYTKETFKQAAATTAAAKSAKFAAAEFAKLNAEKLKEAELFRQIRDDETKTFAERIQANKDLKKSLEEQQKLQSDQIQKQITAAELAVQQNGNDENKLALMEAQNAQLELEETITGQLSEQKTNQVSLEKELLETQNELRAEGLAGMERELEELQTTYDAKIEMARKAGVDTTAITAQYEKDVTKIRETEADKQKAIDKSVKDAKVGMAQSGLALITEIAGESSAIGKAAAIAQTTISGIQSVQEAFKSGSANVPMMTATGGAFGFIQAGLAGAFSAVQLAKIAGIGGGGGGGGGGGAVAQPPAPQMMSGAFDISGGVAPEATKAYVVTDEMSNSQNQLANIRRRATI